jgi:hypothetical protein
MRTQMTVHLMALKSFCLLDRLYLTLSVVVNSICLAPYLNRHENGTCDVMLLQEMFLLVELLALPNCNHPIKLFTYIIQLFNFPCLCLITVNHWLLFPITRLNNCKFRQGKWTSGHEISGHEADLNSTVSNFCDYTLYFFVLPGE